MIFIGINALVVALAGAGVGLSNVVKNRFPFDGELIRLPNLPDSLFIFENDELHEILTQQVLENRSIDLARTKIREISEKLKSLLPIGMALTC